MRKFIFLTGALLTLTFFSCGGGAPETSDLFTGLEPKAAAPVISFLDRRHEPYTVGIDSGAVSIQVPARRLNLLREYLNAPVDSLRYERLVRGAFLSERDSATVHPEPKRSLKMFPVHRKVRTDSLRIGEAFDGLFVDAVWKVYRTRERDIMVEFEGRLKQTTREEPFGRKVLEELTDHREYLLTEVGAPGSRWKFVWLIGVDGKSFTKRSTRITFDGGCPEKDRGSAARLIIDL
ncbi:MAG: hypothetical protein ACYC9O_03250 [Candidatus Latescibacterota bacterium]